VRTLMATIFCYSLFTFLCAFVTNIWQLAFLRVLCGLGIGGEQPVGAAYVAEAMPERRRVIAAGLMHTGYYFGFFFAAVANYFIGAAYGWRWMFIFGGIPALLIGLIRYGVRESPRWQRQAAAIPRHRRMHHSFTDLFSARLIRRTLVMSALFLTSIIGLWGGSVYVPTAVSQLAARAGYEAADAARLASYGSMILAIATIAGCVIAPFAAQRFGRRAAMAGFFAVMALSISTAFGYVFYLSSHALQWFLVSVVFLGLGGASFAMYSLWLPELYTTECRASAIAFISSAGRFVGVGMVFLLGQGISYFGSLGTPVALTAIVFLFGLAALALADETRGKPLPA
jgi:MFS family permease